MSASTETGFVRLFVALVALVSEALHLLCALLKLVAVLVAVVTRRVQAAVQEHARSATASRSRAAAVPYRPATHPFAAPQGYWQPQASPQAPWQPTVQPFGHRGLTLVPGAPSAVAPTQPGTMPVGPAAPAPQPAVQARPAPATRPASRPFVLPSVDCLATEEKADPAGGASERDAMAAQLEAALPHYGVQGSVEDILPGPTVTTYEVLPAPGTKVSKVAGLAEDMSLALGRKVRIVAPIPGKNRIGFELANDLPTRVALRDLVEDPSFQAFQATLPVILGRDTQGKPVFADLASMPHVIVAGATGSGKSVGLNVMLLSMLYRRSPSELRLLMIDPKVVELAPFDGIPHMLLPVVTDSAKAVAALQWAVSEMERRYQLFASTGTKNLASYNASVSDRGQDKLPSIVLVIDEYADLAMQQGKDVEEAVSRLTQKARAAGMHVILATQRPSVDVLNGVIKANFPSRIAYRVAQKVDSRVVLDEQGAEYLLGKGDMLVKLNGAPDTLRVQCPWVSENEVARVTDSLRAQGAPSYDDGILQTRQDHVEAPANPRRRPALRVVA